MDPARPRVEISSGPKRVAWHMFHGVFLLCPRDPLNGGSAEGRRTTGYTRTVAGIGAPSDRVGGLKLSARPSLSSLRPVMGSYLLGLRGSVGDATVDVSLCSESVSRWGGSMVAAGGSRAGDVGEGERGDRVWAWAEKSRRAELERGSSRL